MPLAQHQRPSTIQACGAGVSTSSSNSSAVLGEQLHTTAKVAGRQHMWSASQQKLIVPHYCLNSFGRLCFAVAGPSTWNSLPDDFTTQHWVATCLGVSWRHTFLQNIDKMYSAHYTLIKCAKMYTLLTYLLTEVKDNQTALTFCDREADRWHHETQLDGDNGLWPTFHQEWQGK